MTDEEMITKWTDFYKLNQKNSLLDEADFESLAMGFFAALGASIDHGYDLYKKCIDLGVY